MTEMSASVVTGSPTNRRARRAQSKLVPEFDVGEQLLACIMSERNRKHMRAAPTLTQIDAQARPLNVAAMMREAWIDGIEAAKIKKQ